MTLQGLDSVAEASNAGFTAQETHNAGLTDTAFEAGRVFVTDYAPLKDFVNSSVGGTNKFVYWPSVLYELPSGATPDEPGVARPIAIKIRANGSPDVFVTPNNADLWLKAKIIVGNAGANVATCQTLRANVSAVHRMIWMQTLRT